VNELELAKQLSDQALIAKLWRCIREDHELSAQLLAHLGEVDDRGLYRDQGFSSMFDYCVRSLHMSESEADLRIKAARIGRQFPNALEMLARGELHMTALRLLAPVLRESNVYLLKEACFKSKLEVRELIAKHFPSPDVADSMRRLPQPRSIPTAQEPQLGMFANLNSEESPQLAVHPLQLASQLASSQEHDPVQTSGAPLRAAVASPHAKHRPAVTAPLSEGRYKVQFTASQSLHCKLKEARDLCCDQVPYGELATIVEQAIDLLIAHKKKQRFAQTSQPRKQWLPHSGAQTSSHRCEEDDVSKGPVDAMPHRPRESERSLAKREDGRPVDGLRESERSLAKQGSKTADGPRESERSLAKREANMPEERVCDAEKSLAKHEGGKREDRLRESERLLRKRAEGKPNGRYIPSALRREVYARDGGKCRFVSKNGTSCCSRRDLEFHHVVPFARGGAMTRDNLRLMCRPHNALLAERDYGRDYVKSRVAKRQDQTESHTTIEPGLDRTQP
jgi:5-methylcytosine-specific restriction endonuclease McrA